MREGKRGTYRSLQSCTGFQHPSQECCGCYTTGLINITDCFLLQIRQWITGNTLLWESMEAFSDISWCIHQLDRGDRSGIFIPSGAVLKDKEFLLNVWPCSDGPFQLHNDYELASPVFLISPSFQFTCDITLILYHFSNLATVEDCKQIRFFSAPCTPCTDVSKKRVYVFKELRQGVFEPIQQYGQISLRHFCLISAGRKRKQPSPHSENLPQRGESCCHF